MLAFALTSLAVFSDPAAALQLPSGLSVELSEVLVDDVAGETWLRFRFLAPDISRDTGSLQFAEVEGDMQFLCSDLALEYMRKFDLAGDMVIVTLQDRPVEFGRSDPDATQYIDGFRVTSGACIWEAY